MENSSTEVITHSPAETQALAQKLLKDFPSHKVWLLEGQLGAGKTTFVQGLIPNAKSPTFNLIHEHEQFLHADLYRLTDVDGHLTDELLDALDAGKHLLIEWPQKAAWPCPVLHIKFESQTQDQRRITLSPQA